MTHTCTYIVHTHTHVHKYIHCTYMCTTCVVLSPEQRSEGFLWHKPQTRPADRGFFDPAALDCGFERPPSETVASCCLPSFATGTRALSSAAAPASRNGFHNGVARMKTPCEMATSCCWMRTSCQYRYRLLGCCFKFLDSRFQQQSGLSLPHLSQGKAHKEVGLLQCKRLSTEETD